MSICGFLFPLPPLLHDYIFPFSFCSVYAVLDDDGVWFATLRVGSYSQVLVCTQFILALFTIWVVVKIPSCRLLSVSFLHPLFYRLFADENIYKNGIFSSRTSPQTSPAHEHRLSTTEFSFHHCSYCK